MSWSGYHFSTSKLSFQSQLERPRRDSETVRNIFSWKSMKSLQRKGSCIFSPCFSLSVGSMAKNQKKKQLNSAKTSHVFSAIHVACFRLCPSSNVLSGVVILTLKSSQCPLLLGGCALSTPHKKCNPIFPLSFRGQKEIFVDSGCRVQEVPETKVVVCQGEC